MSGSLTNGLSNTTGTVVGSGSDAITLLMSGDAYGTAGAAGADAEFTLNVDGQQIGGLQDVSASKAAGQDQTFTFLGNFAPGPHEITITFANNDGTQGDKSDFGRGGDRNVYVDAIAYNGQVVSGTPTPIYSSPLFPPNGPYEAGNAVFSVNDTTSVPAGAASTASTTPAAVTIGSGADTLTLSMAEDPYAGDAQFTVAVDGQQVGGTQTTTAIAWEGQAQEFNLKGDWGTGSHTVTVTFLNNAAGAFDASGNAFDNVDRNLYVKGISYDGTAVSGTPWELASNGSQDFSVAAGGQPGNAIISDTTTTSASGVTSPSSIGSSTSDTSGGTTAASGAAAGSSTDNTTPATGATTGDTSATGTPAAGTTTGDTSATGTVASGSTASSGTTTTSDTAPVTGETIGSSSSSGTASGGSSCMSFIPPANTTSATGGTGDISGTTDTSGTSGTGPTAAAAGTHDWAVPDIGGWASSDGSTRQGSHGGAWWASHASPWVGAAEAAWKHAHG